MAQTSQNWIQSAIKKPGALRKSMGVKKGQKISDEDLDKAARAKSSKMRKRASLEKTLRGFQ
jgi:hypothetical protein